MSLLTIVQKAARRCGMQVPTIVVGNTDTIAIRFLELANEEGEELSQRGSWQTLIKEKEHTALAAESQGNIKTICGADFNYIRNQTIWNRTSTEKLIAIDDVQWQLHKARNISGPTMYFRIRGDMLLMLPTPTAGDKMFFEWVSKNWCETALGVGQDGWAADSDVALLPENIMAAGVTWRWKKANGLEYAEDFRQYEGMVANAFARDGAKTILKMGRQGVSSNLPDGNWPL